MATRRRNFRLAEQMREMIAWQVQKAADPRFNLVTITNVVLSPDLKHAKAYWVVSDKRQDIGDVTEAFEAAEGLFKRTLAKELKLRFVPSVKFFYDDTFDVTDSVNTLLDRLKSGDEDEKASQNE